MPHRGFCVQQLSWMRDTRRDVVSKQTAGTTPQLPPTVPFHENIVLVLNKIAAEGEKAPKGSRVRWRCQNKFVGALEVLAGTAIPRDHDEVSDAVNTGAINLGISLKHPEHAAIRLANAHIDKERHRGQNKGNGATSNTGFVGTHPAPTAVAA